MICGPALSSLPHPPHTRAISHSPLPAYQPATTSHHGLNTSKLSTTSSTLSSTFILDYQHHPRQQVVTPHRASVITLETAGRTFQISTHLAHGITHSPSSLAAEIKASTRATYRHRRMFRRLTLYAVWCKTRMPRHRQSYREIRLWRNERGDNAFPSICCHHPTTQQQRHHIITITNWW